jgi:hypothetical protein
MNWVIYGEGLMAKYRVITTGADIDRALQAARQQPDEPGVL